MTQAAKRIYITNTSRCVAVCVDGLAAMTWAFQAQNPGSNPGRRIKYSRIRKSELLFSYFMLNYNTLNEIMKIKH
jgi:hypothetical protein